MLSLSLDKDWSVVYTPFTYKSTLTLFLWHELVTYAERDQKKPLAAATQKSKPFVDNIQIFKRWMDKKSAHDASELQQSVLQRRLQLQSS
ncbi:MAG: hypothetical protein AUJ37_01965 [Candidatus Magasanikbacteria bacterium CG1_02_41_34]|nr:MAG: hypothetical protein AUJ37_01965 [Candidatus Magasanikbacteria bacterium CG1_02_41_34]